MNSSPEHSTIILATAVFLLLMLWRLAWFGTRLAARALASLQLRLPRSRAWARGNPLRALLARRFPRGYGFLARRFDPHDFSGLQLTLMIAAAFYIGVLVAGLIDEVLAAEEMIRLDQAVNAFFNPYRQGPLLAFFAWITNLGASSALSGVAIVATGFVWAYRRPYLILPLWVTILGSESTTWFGKFFFDRARPEFLTDVTALSPSFPSAHATGSMAVYGFVAYAIARDLHSSRERFEVTFWTLTLIALIGFSRIFLSVHYTSDVATGWLVGGFWLLVGFAIAEHRRQRLQAHPETRLDPPA